jgi:hypothetical protein
MNTLLMEIPLRLQTAFWRLAAVATGAALRRRDLFQAALPLAIVAAGGAAAYFLGQIVGQLMRFGPF